MPKAQAPIEIATEIDLARFAASVAAARARNEEGIEAPRRVLEHFNPGKMKAVDDVGYFVYSDVKIYEEGKREEAERRDRLTTEEKVFGSKA